MRKYVKAGLDYWSSYWVDKIQISLPRCGSRIVVLIYNVQTRKWDVFDMRSRLAVVQLHILQYP
ncbi:hypothetical protein RRG08_011116 [Elysia crispata]|uniref:Uncharacterized protein n=1 Tax=Elysia crispata TaxID=231223 RepID=A0AAE1A1T3_9GAST|nr:hypothetical protein RRG08_011116 [Elysia crispata]